MRVISIKVALIQYNSIYKIFIVNIIRLKHETKHENVTYDYLTVQRSTNMQFSCANFDLLLLAMTGHCLLGNSPWINISVSKTRKGIVNISRTKYEADFIY